MHKRSRILSVIGDLGFGGGQNRLLALALNIHGRTFEHIVVTIHEADPEVEQTCAMRRHFAEAGVALKDLGEGSSRPDAGRVLRKAGRLMRRVRKLCDVIKELDIDLVDAHMESAALVGVMAGLMTGRRTAVTLYHPQPLVRRRFWTLAQQFILSCADMIITDSEVRGREIKDAALLRKPTVVVIPNGVCPPKVIGRREELCAVFGLPNDPRIRVIGQIGRLVEFKGHMILLEAARCVLQTAPNAFFLIVGYDADEPGYRQRLERKAIELGIADRVRIVGYPGPIGDAWSLIDIHVHASLFDSLPNAILEGMSMRKPAVVTAVGGIPDAVIHGRSGLVVPPGNAAALAGALLQFLRDPEFARRCGEAAFCLYHQRYRADLTARKLETCFLELLAANA